MILEPNWLCLVDLLRGQPIEMIEHPHDVIIAHSHSYFARFSDTLKAMLKLRTRRSAHFLDMRRAGFVVLFYNPTVNLKEVQVRISKYDNPLRK